LIAISFRHSRAGWYPALEEQYSGLRGNGGDLAGIVEMEKGYADLEETA
jgi:hypothetical protein